MFFLKSTTVAHMQYISEIYKQTNVLCSISIITCIMYASLVKMNYETITFLYFLHEAQTEIDFF